MDVQPVCGVGVLVVAVDAVVVLVVLVVAVPVAAVVVAVVVVATAFATTTAVAAAIVAVVNGIRTLRAGPVRPSLVRMASKSASNLTMAMAHDRPDNVAARAAFSPLLNQTVKATRFVAKLKKSRGKLA